MADPKIDRKVSNGVSKAVYDKVKDCAAGDGAKKDRIDSKAEYDKLSEYLAGNGADMNKAERAFIQEQLNEYEAFAKEESKKEFLDKVTDAAKELVKRFAKGSGADDKKIDSVQEATGLLMELGNPQNDFNAADIEYIQQVVRDSGVLPQNNFNISKAEGKTDKDTQGPVKVATEKGDVVETEKKVAAEKTVPNAVPAENVPNEDAEKIKKHKFDENGVLIPNEGEKSKEPAANKTEEKSTEVSAKPKKTPSSKTPKPKAPTAPKTPNKTEEPKYDENQKRLIREMGQYIKYILNGRNYPNARKYYIEGATKILADAKALGLEDTKEYRHLKALCDTKEPESINAPEGAKSPERTKRKFTEKQKKLLKEMAIISLSAVGVGATTPVAKGIKLLSEAKAENLEDTQEYINLQVYVNNSQKS